MITNTNYYERTQEWSDVKHRLEFSGRHDKGEIKTFEKFFVSQQDPKWPSNGGDPIPLVYRLWFSPDHSPSAWDRIVDQVLASPAYWLEKNLEQSRAILMEEGLASRYDGVDGAPQGFFGGIEERLFVRLAQVWRGRGDELLARIVPSFLYFDNTRAWLNDAPCNPCRPFHFMLEVWLRGLDEQYIKAINGDVRFKMAIRKYLADVVKFAMADAPELTSRHEYCCAVRNELDARQLPPLLTEWWAAAKASAK